MALGRFSAWVTSPVFPYPPPSTCRLLAASPSISLCKTFIENLGQAGDGLVLEVSKQDTGRALFSGLIFFLEETSE